MKGSKKYKVRWKGFSEDYDEWLEEKDLEGSSELLKEYREKIGETNCSVVSVTQKEVFCKNLLEIDYFKKLVDRSTRTSSTHKLVPIPNEVVELQSWEDIVSRIVYTDTELVCFEWKDGGFSTTDYDTALDRFGSQVY